MTQATQELENTRTLDGVTAPAAGVWALDPAHSTVGFVARHMMVTKVRGGFQKFEGEVVVGERPEDSSVNVTIDAASFDSGQEQRDAHVRSADFLDVETYPTITFRSTSVVRTGETTLDVTGDLTVKGVTKPVVLHAEFEGVERAPWGKTVAGFSAEAEIDREEFDITWNAILETGGVVVGRTIKIEIATELVPAE
jgi:polyisoprenoid-binding protein YceI